MVEYNLKYLEHNIDITPKYSHLMEYNRYTGFLLRNIKIIMLTHASVVSTASTYIREFFVPFWSQLGWRLLCSVAHRGSKLLHMNWSPSCLLMYCTIPETFSHHISVQLPLTFCRIYLQTALKCTCSYLSGHRVTSIVDVPL